MPRFVAVLLVLSSVLAVPSFASAQVIKLKGVERTEPVALNGSGTQVLEGGTIAPGSQLLQSFDLIRGGKAIGNAALIETAYRSNAFVVDMTVRLGKATLSGHGVSILRKRESLPTTVAITGGTGRFRGAGGTATLVETSEGKGSLKLDLDR